MKTAVNFVKFTHVKDDKYRMVFQDLLDICKYEEQLPIQLRQAILKEIQS